MNRFLSACAFILVLYACDKETDVVYDTRLFRSLQAHSWVFDSATITDSTGRDTIVHAPDTASLITTFKSQEYVINMVKDTTVLDTVSYQAIYDNPNKIYYYNTGEQVLLNQYLIIDTVNDNTLVLGKLDTLKNTSTNWYHAR